jgi:energy-coupling factor transport system ATP-binding protein
MIKLKNLNVSFGNKKVIKDLSLTVEENEFLYIAGKNGSGKSTLANVILGIIPCLIPAKVSGQMSINGQIGVVLQNPEAQFISMSVREETGDYDKERDEYEIRGILDRSVFEISYGQKQKINLISNIIKKKDILILDEPLELLSPEEARRFIDVIKKISNKKTIIWFDKNDKYMSLADRTIRLGPKAEPRAWKIKIRKRKPLRKEEIIHMDNICFQKERFCLEGLSFHA